ncbi:MAG: flavin-dependent oxidoreductase [Rhodospirillales bacterium]|nr:flavin-dependent oxidoreductase [Rhodospirillales bacterium]
MRVLIVGGGIGGLTTALCLHEAGIEAVVYESAPALRELGVGINLLPHAVRELSALGVQPALASTAIETGALAYYTRYGRLIHSEPRGLRADYQWPQFSIHRGRLLMILARALQARLGASSIRTGHRFARFEQDDDGVIAHFADPATGAPVGRDRGDALIGADGIHSSVRGVLYPDEGPPKFSGITMWRGVTEQQPFLDGRTMVIAGNWHIRVVVYPISRETAERGSSLINWVAEIRDESKTEWRWEDWDRQGRKADFVPAFADWRFDWLDVPRLFQGSETVFEFPMADRDPIARWSFGRVTLLGDAAHPMYPSGSNGAAQAILDARALTRALATQPGVRNALRAYEAERLEPTAEVVRQNREFAAERVLRLVDERCPPDCSNILDYVAQEEMEAISRRYQRIAGFDRSAVNNPP